MTSNSSQEQTTCPHCGEKLDQEEQKFFRINGFYECPECHREGCDKCMPSGRNCICPECEEKIG